jgi:hypothetical protein
MPGNSKGQDQSAGLPRAVQAQEEDREGQLRLGLPCGEAVVRQKLRGEGLFEGGSLQRGQGQGVPDQGDLDHEESKPQVLHEAARGLRV